MAFRLPPYESPDFKLELGLEESSSGNRLSVVIGPNGCGKSRLLSDIARNVRPVSDPERRDFSTPQKVLALANMVSDRFPLASQDRPGYIYLGVRQGTNMVTSGVWSDQINLGFAELSLLEQGTHRLQPALDLIGATTLGKTQIARAPRARDVLERQIGYKNRKTELTPALKNSIDALLTALPLAKRKPRDLETALSRKWAPLEVLQEIAERHRVSPIELLETSAQLNIVYPRQIFEKWGRPLLAGDFSSGEQLVLSNSSRLISNVVADSLVLIDEPETGLHPSWQSMFIPLIHKMIPEEFGCHFIIATHSPHVVVEGTELLIPGDEAGRFEPHLGAVEGRSVETVLYQAFETRTHRNQDVARDLSLLIKAIGSKQIRTSRANEIHAAKVRLTNIAGRDTPEVNIVLGQVTEMLQS